LRRYLRARQLIDHKDGYHIFKMNVTTFAVTELKVNLTGIVGPGLAVDGGGNMYVSSYDNDEVAVFAPGSENPTRIISGGEQDLAVTRDGTLYAMTGAGVEEYRPGSSSPDNIINEPGGNVGFGVAIGPAH